MSVDGRNGTSRKPEQATGRHIRGGEYGMRHWWQDEIAILEYNGAVLQGENLGHLLQMRPAPLVQRHGSVRGHKIELVGPAVIWIVSFRPRDLRVDEFERLRTVIHFDCGSLGKASVTAARIVAPSPE